MRISFNAAISSCEKSGRWQEALKVFWNAGLKAVQRNEVTFNAVINACKATGHWLYGLVLLNEAPLMTPVACNGLLSACEKGSLVELTPTAVGQTSINFTVMDRLLNLECLRGHFD